MLFTGIYLSSSFTFFLHFTREKLRKHSTEVHNGNHSIFGFPFYADAFLPIKINTGHEMVSSPPW
jgi:hypothetical protein